LKQIARLRAARSGLAALILPLAVFAGGSAAGPATLAPEEIRPGMRGTALTVFSGLEPRSFPVELLGVLEGNRAKGDLILFRGLGDTLAYVGVVEGMSGSPVYVDGRLVGAIAFAFAFAKEPFGMITPIGEMLAGLDRADEAPGGWMGGMGGLYGELKEAFVARRWGDGLWDALIPSPVSSGEATAMVALSATGWTEDAESLLGRFAERAGLPRPIPGAAASNGDGGPPNDLGPGSALGVVLIDGDATLSAIGTLTHREGNRILAYGHPLFHAGPVELPMTSVRIHTIVPSIGVSFKMGSAGPIVGAIRQDLRAGVVGVIGEAPAMLPVRLAIEGTSGREVFRYRTARGTMLEPFLLNWVAANSLLQQGWRTGETSVDARIAIHYNGGRTLTRRDRIDTSSPAGDVAGSILGPIPLLLANPFGKVSIDSVAFDLSYRPGSRRTTLVDLRSGEGRIQAGERIRLVARLVDYQRAERELTIDLPVPGRWAGQTLLIVAAGGRADPVGGEARGLPASRARADDRSPGAGTLGRPDSSDRRGRRERSDGLGPRPRACALRTAGSRGARATDPGFPGRGRSLSPRLRRGGGDRAGRPRTRPLAWLGLGRSRHGQQRRARGARAESASRREEDRRGRSRDGRPDGARRNRIA